MKGAGDAEWKLLTDLIESRFGLTFPGVRRDILAARLSARFEALRCANPLEYYQHLTAHPERDREIGQLALTLTNTETYFFREQHHFDIIAQRVIGELREPLRTRPLRVLSAGCSSGEEPYSLVITLQRFGAEALLPHGWEIDACDLNPARLTQARNATYESGALRACDAESRSRHFREEQGRVLLRERHRTGVRFFPCNLATPAVPFAPGSYDVILCRNMLIYFGEAAFLTLVRRFARALRPHGWLMLGHSESLIDKEPAFIPEVVDGIVIYRKRAAT